VHVTAAQNTSATQAELAAFSLFAANPLNAGKTFIFSALGNLRVKNIETLRVVIDPDAPNTAPVIDSASTSNVSVAHKALAAGFVSANPDRMHYCVMMARQRHSSETPLLRQRRSCGIRKHFHRLYGRVTTWQSTEPALR
jgi:hypothetical protein